MLTAPGIRVTLEDTDPYRDCYQWPAAPRLTDEEFARWQRAFGLAWREIQEHHPAYAPALAVGLTALTPMMPAPAGADVSAAARQGFGAVATVLPDNPATLALLLIREFQRVKLGAVLDLYDLFDPVDNRLEELLDGAYANLAVTRVLAGQGGARPARPGGGGGAVPVLARAHCRRDRDRGRLGCADPARPHFVGQLRNAIAVSS